VKEGEGDERMRGDDNQQEGMFSYISPEKRVPADHPLRPIRMMVDEILKEMSPRFAKLYSDVGRPSIAPERLFRSLLLQIFYSVRSERMLIEQLQYNLLFRWFVETEMDEGVWKHAVVQQESGALAERRDRGVVLQAVLERARPFGQGVGEAIPEIQTRRMPAALAEIAVGFAGNSCLGLGNRLDNELCLSEEIVKPSARDGIPAFIDHNCCLDVIDGRNAAAACTGNGLST
jgi:hypothetical protein